MKRLLELLERIDMKLDFLGSHLGISWQMHFSEKRSNPTASTQPVTRPS